MHFVIGYEKNKNCLNGIYLNYYRNNSTKKGNSGDEAIITQSLYVTSCRFSHHIFGYLLFFVFCVPFSSYIQEYTCIIYIYMSIRLICQCVHLVVERGNHPIVFLSSLFLVFLDHTMRPTPDNCTNQSPYPMFHFSYVKLTTIKMPPGIGHAMWTLQPTAPGATSSS
jgi:hypothetical protein